MGETPITPSTDVQTDAAALNRALFASKHVFVLSLVSGPSSGKTSIVQATIEALRDEYNIGVIEGDNASRIDAAKISSQGIAAVRIDAGNLQHLDGALVSQAASALDLDSLDFLIIENVGSLDLPDGFDLGENAKVAISSVPEGDASPLRHPDAFRMSQAVILNKIDAMRSFDFDVQRFKDAVAQANPTAPVFLISATRFEGMEAWADWLRRQIETV